MRQIVTECTQVDSPSRTRPQPLPPSEEIDVSSDDGISPMLARTLAMTGQSDHTHSESGSEVFPSDHLSAPLYSPPPDPNVNWVLHCAGCMTEDDYTSSSTEPENIILCDFCHRWTHIACEEVEFGLPEGYDSPGEHWKCAFCRQEPLWDDNL